MLIGTLPPVSNRADWIDCIEVTDSEAEDADSAAIDLTDVSIVIAIYDGENCKVAEATTDAETVIVVDTGVAEFTFPRATMTTLCEGTYQVGATFELEGETVQILIGSLPVVNGFVPI